MDNYTTSDHPNLMVCGTILKLNVCRIDDNKEKRGREWHIFK